MRIILLQEVAGLGNRGEVKEVKDGYAINFLIPQKLAAVATPAVLKQLEEKKLQEQRQAEKTKESSVALKGKIEGKALSFRRKAEEGKLFGSVTRSDIAKELNAHFGFKLKADDIKLAKPFKELGEFPVPVILPGEIEVTIKVLVEEER